MSETVPPIPVPIVQLECKLAEGPLWDVEKKLLYWTDIPKGVLYCFDPATGGVKQIYKGAQVGGFVLDSEGSLILFRETDIAWLRDGQIVAIRPVHMAGAERFNDVIAAPDGSVFAGTIGKTSESGGLYHFRVDGSAEQLVAGSGCGNGLGFSSDGQTLYWTCSTRKKIFAFDYKNGEVDVASQRELYAASEDEKIPDGMTVDADGNIWSARWDGARLVKISPSGERLQDIAFPRGRVSSVIFGGENLDVAYVTIAATKGEDVSRVGESVYKIDLGVTGIPEFRSRLSARHLEPLDLP
ncbi:MAG: SMP-30/gluconolactonase/LRE family protein [Chthoniobacterales bacterium]